MEKIQLTDDQKDAMQEVANIGASHAATALSQMVSKDIHIGIPDIHLIPLEEIIDCVKSEDVVVGVFLKIPKEAPTYVLLLFSFESALHLSSMLLGCEPDVYKGDLDEMETSAIQEIGNIMMSSFFDSVTELVGISMIPGPPTVAYDMPTAVMEYMLFEMGEIADQVVVFEVELNDEKESRFRINMFLMPEPESVNKILGNLGMS